MESYKVVGKSVLKQDAWAKATGQAKYSGDIQLPGMLWGKILRSPYPHARIVRIDSSQAKALPGVHAVCTAADISPKPIGQFMEDRPAMAVDRVRHIGEPVAAVAADDPNTAEDALDLIQVEYEEMEAIFTVERALEPDAPVLHERLADYVDFMPRKSYGNVRQDARIARGDVEKAFAEADLVFEGHYTHQALHPGYIEPRATVATVDVTGKLTVWCTSKAPFRIRQNLAASLNMSVGKIRVIAATVGGDFGGKGGATIEPIAAALAIKSGRPVKIVLTRTEELGTHYTRHAATVDLKTAVNKDGAILGVQGKVIYDDGAYSGGVGGLKKCCANLQGAYNVPNVDLTLLNVYTNNPPAGQVQNMVIVKMCQNDRVDVVQAEAVLSKEVGHLAPDLYRGPWPHGGDRGRIALIGMRLTHTNVDQHDPLGTLQQPAIKRQIKPLVKIRKLKTGRPRKSLLTEWKQMNAIHFLPRRGLPFS